MVPKLAPAAAPSVLPDAAAGAGSRIGRAGRIEASRSRGAETGRGPTTGPGPEPEGTDASTGMLTMRRPGKTRLSMEGVDLGSIALARPDEAVLPVTPSGTLHPAAGGEQVARDGAGVTMRVAPDGSARFDKGNPAQVWFGVPDPGEVLGVEPEHVAPPIQDLPQHEQAVPGGWNSGSSGAGVVGGFDLTSWAMSKAGMDVNRARKKKLLDDTYEERAQQRAVHTTEQLRDADKLVRKTLTQLWAATSDPAERRQALFELWDECEEGDDARGAAGARARRQILGWIRAKLPAGGPTAYTADELQRLDATRRSSTRFEPY